MDSSSGGSVTVLGVPDSAGAYCVGVERAPAALRDAGLLEALRSAGAKVHDLGDLTTRRWRPDFDRPLAQNLSEEVEAVVELADAAADHLGTDTRLLVLGGSCLVALGVCGAFLRRTVPPRLIYLDRHLDLNTPRSTVEGSLSWMGMAHALRLPDSEPTLADALGPSPLLGARDLVYLGVEPGQTTSWERQQVESMQLRVVPQDELVADPPAAAQRARGLLGAGPFAVHVDVDVLEFQDAPLAENVDGRNSGPTLQQLGAALRTLGEDADCWAISLGQLDPAHAAADPTALTRLIDVLVTASTARSRG